MPAVQQLGCKDSSRGTKRWAVPGISGRSQVAITPTHYPFLEWQWGAGVGPKKPGLHCRKASPPPSPSRCQPAWRMKRERRTVANRASLPSTLWPALEPQRVHVRVVRVWTCARALVYKVERLIPVWIVVLTCTIKLASGLFLSTSPVTAPRLGVNPSALVLTVLQPWARTLGSGPSVLTGFFLRCPQVFSAESCL